MKWIDILSQSLKNLFRRKLRTALTMLGVVIGTAAIIVTISLGYGAEKTQMEQLESTTNLRLITVNPYYNYGNEDGYTGNRITKITDSTVRLIRGLDHVDAVTPLSYIYLDAGFSISVSGYKSPVSLLAVFPEDFSKIVKLKSGTGFTGKTDRMEFVMSEIMLAYFQDEKNPSDDYVDVWGLLYEGKELPLPDIDWYKSKYNMTMTWYDYDHVDEATGEIPEYTQDYKAHLAGILQADMNETNFSYSAVVSMDWVKKWYKSNRTFLKDLNFSALDSYQDIIVMADSVDNVEALVKDLKDMGLQTYSPMEYISTYKEQIKTMQSFLGFIGAISMLVAALSIANTMMMSIYERTREIGVMKVLGCRLGNIRAMFLTEAACIGLIGGAFGLLISYLLSYALNNVEWLQNIVSSIMQSNTIFDSGSGTTSVIPPSLAVTTWIFVELVSLASGFYPAQRAMRLSSLAAIRNSEE